MIAGYFELQKKEIKKLIQQVYFYFGIKHVKSTLNEDSMPIFRENIESGSNAREKTTPRFLITWKLLGDDMLQDKNKAVRFYNYESADFIAYDSL